MNKTVCNHLIYDEFLHETTVSEPKRQINETEVVRKYHGKTANMSRTRISITQNPLNRKWI